MRWYRQSPNTEHLAVIIRARDSYEGLPAMELPVCWLSPGVCTARGRGVPSPRERTPSPYISAAPAGTQSAMILRAAHRCWQLTEYYPHSKDEEISFQLYSLAFNFFNF